MEEETIVVLECDYEPAHTHEFPADWDFGGASGNDPRTDVRWRPTIYTYYTADLQVVHTTQVPCCDDEAIDKFTQVAGWGLHPALISAQRPDEKAVMLPWKYDERQDLVTPL